MNQEEESVLAMDHGLKTSWDDMTFRSSPGSPIVASTVARPMMTNPKENERINNDAELRGSVYGVSDVREQAKKRKQTKFNLSSLCSPPSSTEPPTSEAGTAKRATKTFAIDLSSDDTSDVQEFLRTHNVSDMLERVDFSTTTSRLSTNGSSDTEKPSVPTSIPSRLPVTGDASSYKDSHEEPNPVTNRMSISSSNPPTIRTSSNPPTSRSSNPPTNRSSLNPPASRASTNPPAGRMSFPGNGMGDWSSLNGGDSRPPEVRDSLMSMGTEISETSSLGILPLDEMGSLHSIDSMFLNHTSQAQRPGSGDGGEECPPSPTRHSPVPPSPSRLSWMGSQEGAPLGEERPTNLSRVDSRISGLSIQFETEGDDDTDDDVDDRMFRPEVRGKATGIDSVESSEIDTEDELAAVRKENAEQTPSYLLRPVERLCVGDSGEGSDRGRLSRPGLEGGSSDENEDMPSFPSHREGLNVRQSAEGEVMSPVPGDGGGGGDGMSDGETGSTVTVPSFDIHRGMGMAMNVQGMSVSTSEGRDVEGQSRSQPVGNGIVDEPAPRQVRFASIDRTWQRTMSGSDFGSEISRDYHSSDQSVNETGVSEPPLSMSMSQFLQPSIAGGGGGSTNTTLNATSASGQNWMHNASSFHMSQMSGFQDDNRGDGRRGELSRMHGGVDGGSQESLERTLTPSSGMLGVGSKHTTPDSEHRSSRGAAPNNEAYANDDDFRTSFGHQLSFEGEGEFSELVRESFSSEHSSDRHSSDREGFGGFYAGQQRESTEGASQQPSRTDFQNIDDNGLQQRFSNPFDGSGGQQRISNPFDGSGAQQRLSNPFDGSGPQQQRFSNPFDASGPQQQRFSNPFDGSRRQQQRLSNPFDGGTDQQQFGDEEFMGNMGFGDDEFMSADVGAAVLHEDEKQFEEEHQFNEDDNMEVAHESNFSTWSMPSYNQIEVSDDSFSRISLGTFMTRRTEALGSLSGQGVDERPNFGGGEIVSPPSAPPVAILDPSDIDSPPSNTMPSTAERYAGVGEYTVSDNHQGDSGVFDPTPTQSQRSSRPRISGRESDFPPDDKSRRTSRKSKSEQASDFVQDELERERRQLESGDQYFQESGRPSDVIPNFDDCDSITEQEESLYNGHMQLVHQRVMDLVADDESNRSGSRSVTPPLQIGTIASAIVGASSTTKAEDLAAMIMEYSNKLSKNKKKGASKKPPERNAEHGATGGYIARQQVDERTEVTGAPLFNRQQVSRLDERIEGRKNDRREIDGERPSAAERHKMPNRDQMFQRYAMSGRDGFEGRKADFKEGERESLLAAERQRMLERDQMSQRHAMSDRDGFGRQSDIDKDGERESQLAAERQRMAAERQRMFERDQMSQEPRMIPRERTEGDRAPSAERQRMSGGESVSQRGISEREKGEGRKSDPKEGERLPAADKQRHRISEKDHLSQKSRLSNTDRLSQRHEASDRERSSGRHRMSDKNRMSDGSGGVSDGFKVPDSKRMSDRNRASKGYGMTAENDPGRKQSDATLGRQIQRNGADRHGSQSRESSRDRGRDNSRDRVRDNLRENSRDRVRDNSRDHMLENGREHFRATSKDRMRDKSGDRVGDRFTNKGVAQSDVQPRSDVLDHDLSLILHKPSDNFEGQLQNSARPYQRVPVSSYDSTEVAHQKPYTRSGYGRYDGPNVVGNAEPKTSKTAMQSVPRESLSPIMRPTDGEESPKSEARRGQHSDRDSLSSRTARPTDGEENPNSKYPPSRYSSDGFVYEKNKPVEERESSNVKYAGHSRSKESLSSRNDRYRGDNMNSNHGRYSETKETRRVEERDDVTKYSRVPPADSVPNHSRQDSKERQDRNKRYSKTVHRPKDTASSRVVGVVNRADNQSSMHARNYPSVSKDSRYGQMSPDSKCAEKQSSHHKDSLSPRNRKSYDEEETQNRRYTYPRAKSSLSPRNYRHRDGETFKKTNDDSDGIDSKGSAKSDDKARILKEEDLLARKSASKDSEDEITPNTKYLHNVEAIKQAIEEIMTTSSPESYSSISSLTPSPENTPVADKKFTYHADEKMPAKNNQDMSFASGEDTTLVGEEESGRCTSTPRKASDEPLNRDEVESDRMRINDLIQSSSAANQPPVSSFQAFPSGPHFNVNPPTTIPTLLTSQSLMSTAQVSQYLNDRPIAYSRPSSSLSTHGLASLHIGHDGHSHLPLAATQGAQAVFDSLASNVIPNATASYYPYPHVQRQPPQLPAGPQFMQATAPSSMVHQLQSTYPAAPAGSNFVQSLPSIPSVALAPQPNAGIPGLAATGMVPPQAAQLHLAATATGAAIAGQLNPVLALPDQVRFKDVCCLGIASQSLLPLHNTSSRWLQCTLEIVVVNANGQQITNNPPVFIIKSRTILSPHSTDEMKILFAPHQPGLYQAHLQVGCSPVVADTESRVMQQTKMVWLTALAEKPRIEFDAEQLRSSMLDFGEMGVGSRRSRRVHIINKGRSTVPVRLLLRSSSSRQNFYLTTEAEEWGVSSTAPTHIKLPGKRDDNDMPSSTTVWVHCQIAPTDNAHKKKSDSLPPPDAFSAKLAVELDVPGRQSMTLANLDLKAVAGIARLHAPPSMQAISFSSTVGRTVSRNLPLRNAGTIRLDVSLKVSRASEFFDVIPADMMLTPGQESDVLVKYTPKDAPSVVESLLIMQVKPDGAKYEVVLRGEATTGPAASVAGATSPSSKATAKESDPPILLCNKQYITWGGVSIGRALQQKIVLRNSSSDHPLKLRVSIRGDEEFQLQSHFNTPAPGNKASSGDNNPIILEPSSDYPVHLLFAPSQITTYQATLTIKQSGTGVKYSVPLSGYGGVSHLITEDVDSIGDMYTIGAGPVSTGREFVTTLKVRNSGPRAAFVKVIGFKDLRAKFKLPTSRLSVEPDKFVLNSKQSCKLSLRYIMSDRNAAKCMDRSSIIAVVGFFYGDEIFRQHYKKSLHRNKSIQVKLSSDDPLRGVPFEEVFLGEEQISEESDLPCRPNDQQLFYSCMSRMMVTLVGSAANSDASDSIVDLTLTETPPMIDKGKLNKSQLLPYTPPVKEGPYPTPMSTHPLTSLASATAAVRGRSTSTAMGADKPAEFDSDEPKEAWNVVPERLLLEAPHVSDRSKMDKPVLLVNYTNRRLRFEISWPAGVLAVSPQYGVVEPKSNMEVYVSPRRSIYAKGLELPWSGNVQISCDRKQRDVAIQIREDVVLDTSIHPAGARSPQALQHKDATTPYVKVTSPSPVRHEEPAIRVNSKNVKFPRTKVETTSEASLEFQNITNEEVKWCLSSFAPAYVKQDGEVLRTTYSVFRMARQSGSLGPEQKIKVILTFIPRDEGSYSQFWDLESHGITQSSMKPSNHGIRIELLGEAYKNPPSLEEISLIPKKKNAPDFQMNPISLKKDALEYESIAPGATEMQKLVVSNSSLCTQMVTFRAPKPPFHIKHTKHNLRARHFTSLPITFKPQQPGTYKGTLVIECVGHKREVKLHGECKETIQQDASEARV